MTIEDIRVGMECIIMTMYKGTTIESPVKITAVNLKKYTVMTDAVFYNDKVVSLSKANNHLVFEQLGTVPQIFQNVLPNVVNDKKAKTSYYSIDLRNKASKEFNRRKNFRCYIGEKINVRADEYARTYECILKDVSATGFALVFRVNSIPRDYEKIKRFHFVYNDRHPDFGFNATLNLTGEVRRIVELEDNRLLFGCSIPKNLLVEKYIADVERMKQSKKMASLMGANGQRSSTMRGFS